MTRSMLLLAGACAWACVAANPNWNDPAVADTDGTTAVVDGTSTGDPPASSDAETTEDPESTGSGEPPPNAGGESSSGSGDPACDGGWSRCDGECLDVANDPRHCGSSCTDCRIEFGADAECKHGECGPGAADDGKGD